MATKPQIDLDALSVQQLTDLIAAAEAKRQELQEAAKATMLAKWQSEAEAAGLSLNDILSSGATNTAKSDRQARKDSGKQLPAKFKGPNGETWTGRGRPPGWLATLEAEGKSRDAYKI